MLKYDYFSFYSESWTIEEYDMNYNLLLFHQEFISKCVVREMVIYFDNTDKKMSKRYFHNYEIIIPQMRLSDVLKINTGVCVTIHLYIKLNLNIKLHGPINTNKIHKKITSIILDEDDMEGKIIIDNTKTIFYFYVNQYDGNIYLSKR